MRIVGMIHDDWWGSMLIVNPGIINPTGFCFTNWFPRKQANKLHHSPLIEWETWRTGFRMKDLKVALKNEIVSHVLLSFYVLFGYSSASAGCCKKWPSLTLVMNHAPRRQSGVWKTDGGARSPTARVWQPHLSWPSRTSAGAFSDVSSWEVLAKYPRQTYFSYLRRVSYPHFDLKAFDRWQYYCSSFCS